MVGGQNNEATGAWATVIGGSTNVASGEYSLCAGLESTASGDYSVAIGRSASTNNKDGAMVLGDSNTGDIYASEPNGPPPPPTLFPFQLLGVSAQGSRPQAFGLVVWCVGFFSRFSGGYKLFTNSDGNVGAHLASGSGSWCDKTVWT